MKRGRKGGGGFCTGCEEVAVDFGEELAWEAGLDVEVVDVLADDVLQKPAAKS